MTLIKYDFASLERLTTDLGSQFQRLETLAGDLKRQVTALADNWDSAQGATSYQTAQANWDRVFTEARGNLTSLKTAVHNASNNMSSTDLSVARNFAV